MHGTAIISGLTLWRSMWGNKRVRDQQGAGVWNCSSAFDCVGWWILIGSNRKIIKRLYQPSLGEEMVRPLIRRDDSGNVNRHNCRAVKARHVPCKQTASPITVKKNGERRRGRCFVCPADEERRTDYECAIAQNGWTTTSLSRQLK